MSLKLSISTCVDYNVPIDEQLEQISMAGFKFVSLGENLNHVNFLCADSRKKLTRSLEKYQLEIDTIHACRIDSLDNVNRLQESIIAAAELKAQTLVVHANEFYVHEKDIKDRIDTAFNVCNRIQKSARDLSVKIAIENVHPGNGDIVLVELLKVLDNEIFGFCYDSSHDQIDGPRGYTLLETLKDHLMTVHLSDREKEFVDHMVPGDGFIDFEQIMKILASAKYRGPLLFEVMIKNAKRLCLSDLLNDINIEGRKLAEMIY